MTNKNNKGETMQTQEKTIKEIEIKTDSISFRE